MNEEDNYKNNRNLPVLLTYPEFLLYKIRKMDRKGRKWLDVFLPEIGKWVKFSELDKELEVIGLTQKKWFNRWVLNKSYDYEGPKCENPKCNNPAKFVSVLFGYRKTCCPNCHNAIIARDPICKEKKLNTMRDYYKNGGSIGRVLKNPDLYPEAHKRLMDWYKSGATFGMMNKNPEEYPNYLPYSTAEWCTKISREYYDNIGSFSPSGILDSNHNRFMSGWIKDAKKSDRAFYRSGWEGMLMLKFEDDDFIKKYTSEPFSIKYVSTDGKVHRYVPDLLVEFVDGSSALIEIKADYKLDNEVVKLKEEAGRKYAEENGMSYVILSWSQLELISPYYEIIKQLNNR